MAGSRNGAQRQKTFDFVPVVNRDTICRKLQDSGRMDLTEGMGDCHTRQVAKVCGGCRKTSFFFNRCETMFCPICAPRLARERREAVEWWTKQVQQPKHVVLTARNTATITKEQVQKFKAAFAKLRRRKAFKNWRGGFYSLEVTNEGRGWHLHLHALIEARFIPADVLATEWGKLIGQDFAIVKVKDCREKSYLQEVCKYAVKGSQLAEWNGKDIAALMDAFDGVRTFGAFGELFKLRATFKAWIESLQQEEQPCDCGACNWRFLDRDEWEWENIERERNADPRPPPSPALPVLPSPQLRLAV